MVPITISFFESEGKAENLYAKMWRNSCPSIKTSPTLVLFPPLPFPFSVLPFSLSLSNYNLQERCF